MKVTTGVKQREQRDQDNEEKNNNSRKTKENMTGFDNEHEPKFESTAIIFCQIPCSPILHYAFASNSL